jgi:hypothetical protein
VKQVSLQLERTSGQPEGLVLLQGAFAPVPMGGRSHPPLTHERYELSHEALYPRLCSRLE